jgi:hypothetical protein
MIILRFMQLISIWSRVRILPDPLMKIHLRAYEPQEDQLANHTLQRLRQTQRLDTFALCWICDSACQFQFTKNYVTAWIKLSFVSSGLQ